MFVYGRSTNFVLAAQVNCDVSACTSRYPGGAGPGQHWFTQKLEPAFSSVTVTNAAGERVDGGKPRVSGNQMSVSLRAGGTGTYHVNWRVLSVDTRTTNGNFTFQVEK
jgi:CopC domain